MPEGSGYLLVAIDRRPFPWLHRLFGLAEEVHVPLGEVPSADFETAKMMQQMFDDLRVVEVNDGHRS